MSWQDAYRTLTNPFGVNGSFYDTVIGHRGADYRRGAGEAVPAYEAGVVEYVGSTGGLGGVVGIRLDRGGFAGWAHLDPILVRVGDLVRHGDTLGRAAGSGGNHGSLWDGAHIHTTLSPVSAYAAAVGNTPLSDPAPRIAASIATAPAGDNSTTIPNTKRSGIMETVVCAPNKVIVHIFPGGKHNFSNPAEYNRVRDNIAALRKLGASNLMPLPAIVKVPNVTWQVFEDLCRHVGAPIN